MAKMPKIWIGHQTAIRLIAITQRVSLIEARRTYDWMLHNMGSGSGILMSTCFAGPVLRYPNHAEDQIRHAKGIPCWVGTYSSDPWREYREVRAVVDHASRGWIYDPKTRSKEQFPKDETISIRSLV